MDESEIEAALAQCDDLRATPPAVARRIYERAIASALDESDGPEESVLTLALDLDSGTAQESASARWAKPRVLLSAAALLVAAGISAVTLWPQGQELETGQFVTAGLEQACRDLDPILDDLGAFNQALSVEQMVEIQTRTRNLVEEMNRAEIETATWPEIDLILAQAIRETRAGDPETGLVLLEEARILFLSIAQNETTSVSECFSN